MKKELKTTNESLHLDQNYTQFLSGIKERLQTAQIRAALAANRELIQFYWELGNDLIEKQKSHQWGSGFLEQFSHDMRQAFPEMQGFSVRNLQRIKQFSQLYPDLVITPQAVAQLPWGHISLLIHAVKDKTVREWYAQKTIKNGWSRSVLEMQIEGGLYERQADTSKKITNFHKHLPTLQSDLANEILKDPYNFDFLTIQGKAHERAVEDALVTHIRDFLLELGQGFSFVGSQVPLTFDDQEFFVDLLFYHLHLRAFVVIELKATKFKPEHTGQLGFYLAAVDDLLRKEGDNQTIGIVLCKSKNKVIAEYALRNVSAPIGVSEYILSKAVPKELKTSLPSIEEIEAELRLPMRSNKEKKKYSSRYKNKSRVFSTKNDAPFMTDFFTAEDGEFLVSEIFEKKGCCNDLVKMLNNTVKYCANFFPNHNILSPGKEDEKELFDKLCDDFEKTHDDLHLLLYRYGPETFRRINMDIDEFDTMINSLKKVHCAMPEAIKSIAKSSGKPRGDNAAYATKTLISSLILVYERFTNQKAKDNFKQPKAHGLNYQGNFYKFCAAVFNIINTNFSARCGDSKNIFTIQAQDSLSLGSHIKNMLKQNNL